MSRHTLRFGARSLSRRGASTTPSSMLSFSRGMGRYQPTATDLNVQRRMIAYWTRIASDGNPNGGGNPQWPAATPKNDAYLEIGASTAAKQGPSDAHCDFWDTVPLQWPHL